MPGPVQEYLCRDHEELAALLADADRGTAIDADAFQAFRGRLLRHIGMEEKLLLPAAKRARGGAELPFARQLRLDHSALAALLVPTPTPAIVATLRALLRVHDAMEEGDGGVYAQCEPAPGEPRDALLRALRETRTPKLAPYQDVPRAFASIDRLLSAAGRAAVRR